MDYTKEDKELMLEELLQHREEIFNHLGSIENLVKILGTDVEAQMMEGYWLPSIKGAMGDEESSWTIMISMMDTIQDLQDGLKEEELEEKC